MMNKPAAAAAAILACWVGAPGLQADEIRLKDGTIIKVGAAAD